MRRIEKLLLFGCGYTVLLLTILYLFFNIVGFEQRSIGFGRFMLVLGFGMIISLAGTVFEMLQLKTVYRCLIHYALLLSAFSIIFIAGDFFNITGPASVFIAIVCFTLLYFVIWLLTDLIKRAVDVADNKIEKKIGKATNTKDTGNKKNNKSTYQPIYK